MKKTSNILLSVGIVIIILGIVTGIIVGFFNFIISIPICMLSLLIGGGCASIAGTLGEAQQSKADDLKLLNDIIQKVKNEEK